MKQELESLIKEASQIRSQLKRLDEMEETARSAIVTATDEDVTAPAVQQRIGDARLTLQVVSARRSKLKPPFSLLHKKLLEEFKREGSAWNDRVRAVRQAKEDELVAALLPFFLDDAKAARRKVKESLLYAPVFAQYREAIFGFPYYPEPGQQDLVRDVKWLLDHCKRHEKALGLG
jgi:hypothetical protein